VFNTRFPLFDGVLAKLGSAISASIFFALTSSLSAADYKGPPESAVMSYNGLRAAWVDADGNSIITATRAKPGAAWSAATRLLSTRGTIRSLVFSPDDGSIAYENYRTWKDDGSQDDAWQFIAVYDLKASRISYVDPSFETDREPNWSADGKSITFMRSVAGAAPRSLTKPVVRLQLSGWKPRPKQSSELFTLPAALGVPFIYPPVASGDGTALVFVTREGKARRVYFWRAGRRPRRLVDFPNDDGQELQSVAVSQRGEAVAFVRGGNLNRQGDVPNPTGLPERPRQQVWLVGSSADVPRALDDGTDPQFSPDGLYLLWRKAQNIWAAPLSWKAGRLESVGTPFQLLSGPRTGFVFSPDGKKIAYESNGSVEVYDFATKSALVVPRGSDVDFSPVWSPDSRYLAFIRGERPYSDTRRADGCDFSRYCGPPASSNPWAIWKVQLSELTPVKLWQARAGRGSSFYGLDQSLSPGQGALLWTAYGRVIFPYEGDGWLHLYSVPVAGGASKLLTPGDGEVETAALGSDGHTVFFASNIGDLGRRHLSTVTDNGATQIVAQGDRSFWSPVPLKGNGIAYLGAGWNDGPRLFWRPNGRASTNEFRPLYLQSSAIKRFVKPRLVEFAAADGKAAFGQLFLPRNPAGCAILFSHGGGRRQMLPGFHYMDAYQYLYELNQYLASNGCAVLSVDYRSGTMHGEAFRNAPGWGFDGNTELQDFVGAVKWLREQPFVDPTKGLGIYGLSWGGYMTANALSLRPDLFTVGFDMAGVHFPPTPDLLQHSAIGNIENWKGAVFLVQGDDDRNVDFDQGIALAHALITKRPDVEFKQKVLPGQTHDLYLTFEQLVDVYQQGADFLLSHLKGKKSE
jgi:dipeptidyl aminopeptidase/acylaminoacyl peptidase